MKDNKRTRTAQIEDVRIAHILIAAPWISEKVRRAGREFVDCEFLKILEPRQLMPGAIDRRHRLRAGLEAIVFVILARISACKVTSKCANLADRNESVGRHLTGGACLDFLALSCLS
jgi:hypothetical protein